MASIGIMIEQISALADTTDVNEWENEFITNVSDRYLPQKNTMQFTAKQVEIIEKIWKKHYA